MVSVGFPEGYQKASIYRVSRGLPEGFQRASRRFGFQPFFRGFLDGLQRVSTNWCPEGSYIISEGFPEGL